MAANFETYFSQINSEQQGSQRVVDYSGLKLQTYANGLAFEIASMPEESEALESSFRWYRPQAGDRVFDTGAFAASRPTSFPKPSGRREKSLLSNPIRSITPFFGERSRGITGKA